MILSGVVNSLMARAKKPEEPNIPSFSPHPGIVFPKPPPKALPMPYGRIEPGNTTAFFFMQCGTDHGRPFDDWKTVYRERYDIKKASLLEHATIEANLH